MKFKVVGESFKKYAKKDPERMDNHMGDETPEDIYNELKKRSVKFMLQESIKEKGELLSEGQK